MKSSTSIWTVLKYATACISLFIFSSVKSLACGPDFTGFQYTLLLEHYTFNNKFFPYQFDPGSRFYSLSWQDNFEEEDIYKIDGTKYNIASWRAYLKLPLSMHDSEVKNFIYNNSIEGIKKSSLEQRDLFEIENGIQTKKNKKEIWHYLLQMNEYKKTLAAENEWDYSSYTKTISLDTVKPFIAQCENLIQETDDVFLQWRLLYLILRASHFNKHHTLAIAEFEKYYPKFTKDNSLAQYWCEGMYAGALLRTKHDDKAIYYSARAFANSPDQHMDAMNTYLFSNRNWKSALPYCKDAKDSVYVAMLEGANHPMPDMEFIQMVYNTNPNSEVLKFLWLREANKIEEFLLNKFDQDNYFWDYDTRVDMDSIYRVTNTLTQFLSLSETILTHVDNIPAKTTVANCIAFYYYKVEMYEKAASYLEKVASLPKDEIENTQYQLLVSLIKLKNNNQFDTKDFISLLNDFKKVPSGSINHHVGYYLLYNEIAPYLLLQKDTAAAFWTYTFANSYESEEFDIYSRDYSPESWNHANFATYLLNQHFTIEQVLHLKKDFINQKGNSEFETYLIKNVKLLEGAKLFDLVIARKYMLAEQWDKALALYSELPVSFTEQMGPNPANFYINDYIEADSTEMKKNIYSVKQILELAQKLKSNSVSSAKDKLLYGTLLYNLSYYGKNHYVLDNHWNHSLSQTPYYDYDSTDAHIFVNNNDYYDMPLHNSYQNYFHLQIAEKYLNEALPLLKGEEKVQCTFLLAKCWQKRCPQEMKYNTEYKYMEDVSDYVGNSVRNPYFKKLIAEYKSTKTGGEIFNTCSYYRMFLGKK